MTGSRSEQSNSDHDDKQQHEDDDGLNLPFPRRDAAAPRATTPDGKGDKGMTPLSVNKGHRRVVTMPDMVVPPLLIKDVPNDPDPPSTGRSEAAVSHNNTPDDLYNSNREDREDSEYTETSYDRGVRSSLAENVLSPSPATFEHQGGSSDASLAAGGLFQTQVKTPIISTPAPDNKDNVTPVSDKLSGNIQTSSPIPGAITDADKVVNPDVKHGGPNAVSNVSGRLGAAGNVSLPANLNPGVTGRVGGINPPVVSGRGHAAGVASLPGNAKVSGVSGTVSAAGITNSPGNTPVRDHKHSSRVVQVSDKLDRPSSPIPAFGAGKQPVIPWYTRLFNACFSATENEEKHVKDVKQKYKK
jgi:hypothetical protein